MRNLLGVGYPRFLIYAFLAGVCFGLSRGGFWLLALLMLLGFLAGHVHAVLCQSERDSEGWE